MKKKLRKQPLRSAIDVFCGAGGLSLGLRAAGFHVVAAIENDAAAAKTYRTNLAEHLVEASVDDFSSEELLTAAGLVPGECDLLAGGPPCQGFSVQRRGDDKDFRNHLVLRYLALVESIRPRFFIMENVQGLMSKRGIRYFNRLSERTGELGYVVRVAKLNAADFGVPQRRIRVFIVGEHERAGGTSFAFPKPLIEPRNYRTVRFAIGDLPSPPDDGSPHPQYPLHFREGRLSKANRERFRHIPEGGGRDDLPPHLQLPCHINNPSHRHKDVYGRMAWDSPAPTLTARFDSFSRGRFGHPVEHRTITLREGARLQTFPDEFHFLGNREQVARQIGNAVPPRLARLLGEQIIGCLERPTPHSPARRAPESRSQLTLSTAME